MTSKKFKGCREEKKKKKKKMWSANASPHVKRGSMMLPTWL
jgi:hypothetical protein